MNITLKNLKYSPSLSEETNAFTADVYVDGKKEGTASNHGTGGNTDIWPRELEKRIDEYAKTLPPVVTDMMDPHDKTKPFTYAVNSDHIIDELVEAFLKAKDEARIEKKFKKDIATRILSVTNDGKLFTTKPFAPTDVARLLADKVYLAKQSATGRVCLNLLPLADARSLWMKAVVR